MTEWRPIEELTGEAGYYWVAQKQNVKDPVTGFPMVRCLLASMSPSGFCTIEGQEQLYHFHFSKARSAYWLIAFIKLPKFSDFGYVCD
jgi:hypothetical protein